ncbi:SPOR domain-containing protein [Tenacibaculum xiamenense]|uniref:SPOR domain-containing protein n=1 Tax=Tenacibaculum xiamenense TaxID=1261553 RepID=UPI003894A95F
MPFIEEAKYQLMQEDIDATKLKLEEREKEFTELQENVQHQKQKSRTIAIVLGLLLGLSLGIIFVMVKNGSFSTSSLTTSNTEKIDIDQIKAEEAQRVIDSITNVSNNGSDLSNDLDQEDVNLDDEMATIEENNNGQTVYSVQIGVFSKNKYPLLSENSLAGIASKNSDYFKYSLGIFASLSEAKKLKSELVKIGFKDAFVASYINGERQQIHH